MNHNLVYIDGIEYILHFWKKGGVRDKIANNVIRNSLGLNRSLGCKFALIKINSI